VALVLLAALLAAAAASVASVAFFALALGLAVVAVSASFAVVAAGRRLTVVRTIARSEVQEHEVIQIRFEVEGPRWLPVRLQAQHQSGTWVEVGRGQRAIELTVGSCGAYWLAPSRLRLCDALGVCHRALSAGQTEPLFILPTPDFPVGVSSLHGAATDDLEPDGVDTYVPGASPAHIHWPALARGAGIQVRRFAPYPRSLPLVVVDTAGARNSLALQWTARRAAGHVLALARGGGCRVLLPGDARATTITTAGGEWRAMHRRLATLQAPARSSPPEPARHGVTVHIRASAAPEAATGVPAPELPPGVLR
jgi:uncharacterized protein (DUF58 family)